MNVSTAAAITSGTNHAATASATAGSARGSAGRWRPCRRCARAPCRCRPSWRASGTQPVWFTVPAITASPACFSTGIGSPVSIDSSTRARAFDDLAVDRNLLAGPHAEHVAGVRPDRPADPSPRRLVRSRARSAARAPAVRGSRCRYRLRARSSSTCPNSTSAVITAAASKYTSAFRRA